MSHHSMGSIPCQEAYLGPEAQKYYSSLGILLATQTHFFCSIQTKYCSTLCWFHSASAQGSPSDHTTSSSKSATGELFFHFGQI